MHRDRTDNARRKRHNTTFQDRIILYNRYVDFSLVAQNKIPFPYKNFCKKEKIDSRQIARDKKRYKNIIKLTNINNEEKEIIEKIKEIREELSKLPKQQNYIFTELEIKPLHREIMLLVFVLIGLATFTPKEQLAILRELRKTIQMAKL